MWLNTIWALLRKDTLLELRRRESIVAMAAFGVLSLLLYNFALPLDGDQAADLAPGLLWVSITFTAMLGLGKAFAVEQQNDIVDTLVMSPAPKAAVFLGKLISNALFILIIQMVMIPLFAAFFSVSADLPWAAIVGSLTLGTIGLATLGTLFSAMTVSLRAREVVFPLLLLPLMVPVIIATSQALSAFLSGETEAAGAWIRLLLVADFVYLVSSLWVFEFLVED